MKCPLVIVRHFVLVDDAFPAAAASSVLVVLVPGVPREPWLLPSRIVLRVAAKDRPHLHTLHRVMVRKEKKRKEGLTSRLIRSQSATVWNDFVPDLIVGCRRCISGRATPSFRCLRSTRPRSRSTSAPISPPRSTTSPCPRRPRRVRLCPPRLPWPSSSRSS